MKIAKACKECRLGKRRCTPSEGGSCQQCLRRSSPCSFAQRVPARDGVRDLLPKAVDEVQLELRTKLELTDLYIRLIHDKPHTLFHPPTLRQEVQNETLPDKVLYGVLAMAAPRLSRKPEIARLAPIFSTRARDAIKKDLESISLESIQACVLAGNLCGIDGENEAEALYFGIALRIASIIHLPRSVASDSIILQEVRLRVWWSLYMIDRWSSAGSDLPRQLQDTQEPLPMDETQFECLTSRTNITRPGLWGRMVQLASIFCEVQDLHRQHVAHEISDEVADVRVQFISAELDSFVASLPPEIRLTEENTRAWAHKGVGSAFVALHLGYHHYSTLLYFHYLDLQIDRTANTQMFAAKCKYHAAGFSDLLSMSQRIEGCDAVYFIVAHMAVVSSAALLHTLLFGGQDETEATRSRLQSNFSTLVELRKYWPAVEALTERLFVFQRACMWSADPNTHRVDRWMVRFLLHHALPVPEKIAEEMEGYTIRDKYADDAMAILRETN
ncbi:hypothetical protein CC79DRAFT_1264706 [Sarocladium strictum]